MTASAVGLGLGVALLLRLPLLGDLTVSYVSNVSQLLAAAAACLACGATARRTSGSRRHSWVWFSIGTGCWAAGQVVWSWYELVLRQDVPAPSAADVGFLLFPVAMAIGLVTWLSSQGAGRLAARGRDLLDGGIIAISLLSIAWVAAFGTTTKSEPETWLSLVVSIAYPVSDVVVATLVLTALVRGGRGERLTLAVLALGVGGLAVADSAFAYLTRIGSYSSADVISSGWVLGFLLIAAAAVGVESLPAVHSVPLTTDQPSWSSEPTVLQQALPYIPTSAAGVVLFMWMIDPDTSPTIGLCFGLAIVVLVLGRQFLGLRENGRLLAALGAARDQLQHQATHDELTGLADRGLFIASLREALRQPTVDVSVLFCDLDDFKTVNDRHGHGVGDELLVVVAQRLQQCVRSGDTVARLGGDEFAVLVQSEQAVLVAERIVELVARPVEVHGHLVSTSASIGISRHHTLAGPHVVDSAVTAVLPRLGTDADALATSMLREADAAMYSAKDAGKGRVVLREPPMAAG